MRWCSSHVAAEDERAVVHDPIPEERRDLVILRIAGQLVLPRGTDDLRNLGIGVNVVQRIDVVRERIDDAMVLEPRGGGHVARVARDRIQVREALDDPALLGLEHGLPLLGGEPPVAPDDPVGLLLHDVQRLRVARQIVRVDQARHDLVERVIRRPHALPRFDAIDQLLGKRREIAGMELRGFRGLDFCKFRHEAVRALLEPLIARARVHDRDGRQVVADCVAAELDVGRLPPAKRFSGRWQSRGHAEVVQQTILVEAEQVFLIANHRVAERAVEQTHVLQRERHRLQRDLVGHPVGRARRRPDAEIDESGNGDEKDSLHRLLAYRRALPNRQPRGHRREMTIE